MISCWEWNHFWGTVLVLRFVTNKFTPVGESKISNSSLKRYTLPLPRVQSLVQRLQVPLSIQYINSTMNAHLVDFIPGSLNKIVPLGCANCEKHQLQKNPPKKLFRCSRCKEVHCEYLSTCVCIIFMITNSPALQCFRRLLQGMPTCSLSQAQKRMQDEQPLAIQGNLWPQSHQGGSPRWARAVGYLDYVWMVTGGVSWPSHHLDW